MQRKRLWAVALITGVAAVAVMLLTDMGDRGAPPPLPGDATVPDIADRLAQEGLGCEAVLRNEPPPPDEQNELGTVESALTDRDTAPKQGYEGSPDAWLVFEQTVLEGLQDQFARKPTMRRVILHSLVRVPCPCR